MIQFRNDRGISRLAGTTLFETCTRRQLSAVGAITTEVRMPAGKVLCAQGDPGREFFVVIDGHAGVAVDDTELPGVGPGGFFGELALLGRRHRTATVTATSPMTVLVLNRGEFRALLDLAPTAARTIRSAADRRLACRGPVVREPAPVRL